MKIVIAGDAGLIPALADLVGEAGHEVSVFANDELMDETVQSVMVKMAAGAEVAIEYSPFDTFSLEPLASSLPPGKLYLASALTTSATNAGYWAASGQGNADRVVGWAALPPIVGEDGTGIIEVARGLQTSDAAFEAAVEFWQSLGLEAVEVGDGPGLVRARVLCSLINEAVSALADGVASAQDIDAAMQLGNNYPEGLLAWADRLGLDLVVAVLEGLREETGESRYNPHPLLRRKVWAGHLGKESGRGFFEY